MMLHAIIFILASVLYARGATQDSAKCPQWCTCEDSAALCENGSLPLMGPRITTFQLKNASPPIPELSPNITRHLQYLVSLTFDAAGLTNLQPNALGLIEHLEDLYLTNNNFTVIHNNTFLNCSSLVNLFLDSNNLQVIHKDALVPLRHLQKLSLSHNSLITLPTSLPPNLQSLSVHHNLIQKAPPLTLHSLTSLNLCYNLIENINPEQISLKNLKELCLGGSKFHLGSSLINPEEFPVLESLHLKGSSVNLMVDDSTLRNIQNMSTTSLSTLELDLCMVTSLRVISEMSTLHTLKLRNVTPIGLRITPEFFILPPIAVLDISGSPSLAKTFLSSRVPRMMTSLKVLRMSRCGVTHFPKSFHEQNVPNITRLDLSFNPLKCTCDLSWIPNYVRDGRLALEKEQHTICANPTHLRNIPLLTATLCPFVGMLPTTKVPETSNTDVITPTQVFPEWSTESSDESSKVNTSRPDSTTNGATSGLRTKQLLLVIFGSILASILGIYILLIFGRCLLKCYKSRNFDVSRATNISQEQLAL